MPNMNDYVWFALIALVLLFIAIYLTYYFLSSNFKVKLNGILDRENELKNQYVSYKTEAENQISELKNIRENITQERNALNQQVTSLSADIKNFQTRINEFKSETLSLSSKIQEIDNERNSLNIQLTQVHADNKNLNQKLQEERTQLEELNQKFQKEFENLANKILEEKSAKFATQNKESLEVILNPLQEKIKGFEKRVEDTHKESIERSAKLRQQIFDLKELNEQMSKEANNLTRALKGESKTQGNWGEMILESVLEKSGLQKDLEYFVQQNFNTDEGKRVSPDVIIHLPGDKKMIVDSKVSLNAYEKYVNEPVQEEKAQWAKLHVQSVKRHIEQLSAKNYHQIYTMDSPDFVLLFIPVESAFALASHQVPSLYQDAFERNIILVTPTTLLAVLRTIDTMWQNEKQKKNAIEIATQAGNLYDTFSNLLDELLKVGRQMDTAKGSYDTAMKKLTGNRNLFKNMERLKKLGAKTTKQIDAKIIKRVDLGDEDE